MIDTNLNFVLAMVAMKCWQFSNTIVSDLKYEQAIVAIPSNSISAIPGDNHCHP
jgi:hypothetical protein